MDLYILRHADAVDRAPSDAQRQLTPKGLAQANRVAAFLKPPDRRPDIVVTSPFIRARQTAAAIAKACKVELIEAPWAACGMHPNTAQLEIQSYAAFKTVLLCGHQPDLSHLIGAYTAINEGLIDVRKASLTHLTLLSPTSAVLNAFIPCKLLPTQES
jgi:phosphohistidine phosphatase